MNRIVTNPKTSGERSRVPKKVPLLRKSEELGTQDNITAYTAQVPIFWQWTPRRQVQDL